MEKFKLPNIEDEITTLKSIRIKVSTLKKVEHLSDLTGISVNRILTESIEFALNNLNEKDLKNISEKKVFN